MSAFILSTGSYVPYKCTENSELTQFPPNVVPLIEAKTGIKSRHWSEPDKPTSYLAIEAAKKCLKNFDVGKIGAVLLATSTPDRLIPATAARVAEQIGAKNAFCLDINSVCTGSICVLELAKTLVLSRSAEYVLAIAADSYSKILDMQNFSTAPYFGDGAGCALVSADKADTILQIKEGVFHTDGGGFETITVKAGGSETPFKSVSDIKQTFFSMNGRAVYEFATSRGAEVIVECLQKNKLDKGAVTKFILHQANINIIKAIAAKLEEPMDKFFVNLDKYGNTAGASTLIALDECLSSGRGEAGHLLMSAFGGGLTWGALLLEKYA